MNGFTYKCFSKDDGLLVKIKPIRDVYVLVTHVSDFTVSLLNEKDHKDY